MKCLVCQKEFTGNTCPRCGFPVVQSTDVDALLDSMRTQIEEYRRDFQAGVKLSLRIFRWKEDAGLVVPDKEELLPFGTFSELRGKVTWLSQQFARIPDAETLDLQVRITAGETQSDRTVSIPNLPEASLQTVGIETTEDMRFRLMLRNDMGAATASEWSPIL